MREQGPAVESVGARAWLSVLLLLLLVEKVVQHIVVTYAFATDWGGIRASVALPYEIFMVAGAVLVPLFALATWWLLRRDPWARGLIIALALTDIVGEFVAQGRLFITINVSVLVATALLILALAYHPRRGSRGATLRPTPDA